MYQYQYDPTAGLWMLVALAALVSAFVVGPLCYLLGRRHGRLQAQPIARFLPGEQVLQPGYGMPAPLDELDEAKERNMAAMLQVAADAWQGKSTWWQDEQH